MLELNLNISENEKSYRILIQRCIWEELSNYINNYCQQKKAVVITDTNVYTIYSRSINEMLKKTLVKYEVIVIEPGEKSKSYNNLIDIYNRLANFNVTRSDFIITIGGGVVGDLGGFAAATYLRGISYIQVPTTLLAQVDSSVGGKTAVNLPAGKNMVGSFYHPKAVFVDPNFLYTLDKRNISEGFAEIIKYACIKDSVLFDKLMYNEAMSDNDIEEIIFTCCKIKSELVEKDEKDQKERMLLNFGHTLGHAIERYYDYEHYSHGEAVAIGMAEITKRSEELGITREGIHKKLINLLKKYELPYEAPKMDKAKIFDHIKVDKKQSIDTISLVLITDIGKGLIKKINMDEVYTYFNI